MKTLLLILIFGIGVHAQTPDLQKAAADARIAALELKVQEQALQIDGLRRESGTSAQALKTEQSKSAGLQDTASRLASERDEARTELTGARLKITTQAAQIELLTNERDLLKKQLASAKKRTVVAIIAAVGLGIARIF